MASAEPLRVAAMMATESVSGPGRQLAAAAVALRPLGVETRVILFRRTAGVTLPYAAYLDEHGLSYDVVDDRGPLDWTMVRRVRRVLEAWQPALLQSHAYKATAVAFALRRTGWPTPWIGFFHGSTAESRRARFYHRVDRLLLRSADRVIVMSRLQESEFAAVGPRVAVLHNAVIRLPHHESPADVQQLQSALGALPRPVVAVVGRLSHEKGVDIFLEALARIDADARPGALIVGDGPDRSRLEALARERGLGSHVAFLGHFRAVHRVYSEVDAVVIPSRSEGLPNVLLEAIDADRAVISTRVGAVTEVVDGGDAAVIVRPEDPDALGRALAAFRLNGEVGGAAAARAVVRRRFSLDERARQLSELYQAVARGHVRVA